MKELLNILKNQQRSVVVVGSANVDMVAKVPRMPKEGESLRGDSLSVVFGGKGANQAVALARLGAKVRFIACVGKDQYGKAMKQNFKNEGIPTHTIKEAVDSLSGTALIFVDKTGKNSIVVIPGANHDLKPKDVIQQKGIFKKGDVFLTQLELLSETVEASIILAKEAGLITIVDAGPPRKISKYIFPYIDIISPNETETEFLVGKKPETKKDCHVCAEKLMKMGARAVVLKLGVRGCFYSDGEKEFFINGYKINTVDTTAAGDAFTAGLALAWGRTSIEEALQFANAVGALACTRFGAQPSMPTLSEVSTFLKQI
ncbi:MAG: ribokinase [Candidatus Hydrogenedens sp.]|nr:ribokinase [Candidatus Hydrogenedens sp.]